MSYVQKLSYFTKKIYVDVKRTDVVLLKGEVDCYMKNTESFDNWSRIQ